MRSILFVFLAACAFQPSYGDGQLECGPGGACPGDLVCAADKRCYAGAPDLPDAAGPSDTEAPRLLRTTPTHQDTLIEPTVAVRAEFSEAIEPASATATTFRLAFAGGEPVPGTIAVDGSVVTFTPDARLAPGSAFAATITAGITDLAGNPLAAGATFTFETRAGAWTEPAPLETSLVMSAADLDIAVSGDHAIAVWRMLSCSSASTCGPGSELWASVFHDGAWSPAATVTATDVIQPRVAINGSGKAMVIWYDGSAKTSIYANYYDGTSWSSDAPVETEELGNASFPDVALDEAGKAYAVWQQSDGTNENIWANVFDGSTWGTAEKIELSPDAGSRPSVIVSRSGRVLAVWEQGGQQWGNDFADGAWGGPDLLGSDQGYPSCLVAGSDGSVTAVWRGADMNASRFTGSWTDAIAIDDSADPLIVGGDLAINREDEIMAVWLQGAPGAQHVWHAHFTPPSTWSDAKPIESNGGAANFPGVAYGTGGLAMSIWVQTFGTSTSAWVNLFERGRGWGAPAVIDPDLTGVAIGTRIFFDPGTGTFNAVWLQSGSNHTSPMWSQFQ